MQEPSIYSDIQLGQQPRTITHAWNRLFMLLLPILIVALIGGSLYWLHWAAQRGIELGYPTPQVRITLAPSSAQPNQVVDFSAQGSGRGATYNWYFGDGEQTTATGLNVSHIFSHNGNYYVTVVVTDAIDHTTYDTTSIRVMPPPPTASFRYSEELGYYGGYNQTIDFDASGSAAGIDASITTYSWDFGDGNTYSYGSPYIQHYYYSTGIYNVTLVVTDNVGQQSTVFSTQVAVQ